MSTPLTAEALPGHDIVIVFVPQLGVDWDLAADGSSLVLDRCNALGKRGGKIRKL